jgi:subtilisin family serine protease
MEDQATWREMEGVVRGMCRQDRKRALADFLKLRAETSQQAVLAVLERGRRDGVASDMQQLWMGNAVMFSATATVIEELASIPGVGVIDAVLDHGQAAHQDGAVASVAPVRSMGQGQAVPEPNIAQLQAPDLWNLGITGEGVLIGILDTGTWWPHPDLVNRVWVNPGETPWNFIDDDGNGKVDDIHGWDFVHGTLDLSSDPAHRRSAEDREVHRR